MRRRPSITFQGLLARSLAGPWDRPGDCRHAPPSGSVRKGGVPLVRSMASHSAAGDGWTWGIGSVNAAVMSSGRWAGGRSPGSCNQVRKVKKKDGREETCLAADIMEVYAYSFQSGVSHLTSPHLITPFLSATMPLTRNHPHFLLASMLGISVLNMVSFVSSAQALPWTVLAGTQSETGLIMSGSFRIDDELAAAPEMLANILSFVFDTPLTSAGGTISLDRVVSAYTPFSVGLPSSVSGSVKQVPGPLPVLGVGAALAWSRKPKRRLAQSRSRHP